MADINPDVNIFPCMALPVELINPTVNKLPPDIFAAEVIVLVAEINPAVNIFPPVMLPAADINPAVTTFPPITLPLTDTIVPNKLDPIILPVADINPVVLPNLVQKTSEAHIPIYFVNFIFILNVP